MIKQNQVFKKVLNSSDVVVTAFGAMIGWGWVVSSGGWIQSAGALGTAVGFIVGGILIYFVGLVYAELTTAMPETGGPKVFSNSAFGSTVSFACSWAMILSYVGVVCFEACSLPTIIQYIFPNFLVGYLYTIAGFDIYASWLIVGIVFAALLVWVNVLGIKSAAMFQKTLTFTIAGVGILLIVASAINGSANNLAVQSFVGEDGLSVIKNILSISVVAPFFLFGFDVIPQAAEEINVPIKKIGKLLIFSIVLAVLFYALVCLSIGYGLNSQGISESMNNTGLVAADAMSKLFNSDIMAKVLIIGGLCGIVTSWNSFLIGGSRILYAMSKSNMVPKKFSYINKKYKTPIFSLAIIGLLSVLSLFFGRVMLVWISNVASFSCCVTYCIVSLSFLKLRRSQPALKRPFKVNNGKLVGIFACAMACLMIVLYLIPNTGCSFCVEESLIALTWLILGLIIFIFSKIKYNERFGKS